MESRVGAYLNSVPDRRVSLNGLHIFMLPYGVCRTEFVFFFFLEYFIYMCISCILLREIICVMDGQLNSSFCEYAKPSRACRLV